MFKKSRRQRERPIKAVALIGIVWLITLSVAAVYEETAPTPANAAAAVSRPIPAVQILGSRA